MANDPFLKNKTILELTERIALTPPPRVLNLELINDSSAKFKPESLIYLQEILSKNTHIEQGFIVRLYQNTGEPLGCGWLFPCGNFGENDIGMYGITYGWITAMLFVDLDNLSLININLLR